MYIQGIAVVLVGDSSRLTTFVQGIIGSILIAVCIAWCSLDAMEKGEILHFGWILGIFLLAPIIFPSAVTLGILPSRDTCTSLCVVPGVVRQSDG